MKKSVYEQRSVRNYQKKAKHYEDTFDGRYTLGFKIQLLKALQIPDGGQVLDVACGNGRLLEMLSRTHRFAGFGVDISSQMVACAAQLNPTMAFQQASCDALPFPDNNFDILTVCAAYHHFPDVAAFAKEAFRVLKRNGGLYIAEVYYPTWLRKLCNPLFRFSRAGDVRLYGPEEILQALENAGFSRDTEHFHERIQVIGVQKKPDAYTP